MASASAVCAGYLMGECPRSAEECRFAHDASFCRFYLSSPNGCRFGDKCRRRHDVPASVLALVEKRRRANNNGSAPATKSNNAAGGRNSSNGAAAAPAAAAPPRSQAATKTTNSSVVGPAVKKQQQERDAAASDADSDEYGAPRGGGGAAAAKSARGGRKAKNTETFEPSHAAPDLRVVVDLGVKAMTIRPQVRDITLHPLLFTQKGDEKLYERLTAEVEAFEARRTDLLKSWHGDSHWIADDSTGWKKACPTFNAVIERIRAYFKMDIKATRFNWYKDQSEWKPFHHDAAAVKPDKAQTQNFTVGVSFGCTRDAAFEEAQSKKVVSFPLTNGSTYCFARDTNILWKHGILQVPPQQQKKEGRISIIAWGWVDQDEVNAKPAKLRKSA